MKEYPSDVIATFVMELIEVGGLCFYDLNFYFKWTKDQLGLSAFFAIIGIFMFLISYKDARRVANSSLDKMTQPNISIRLQAARLFVIRMHAGLLQCLFAASLLSIILMSTLGHALIFAVPCVVGALVFCVFYIYRRSR